MNNVATANALSQNQCLVLQKEEIGMTADISVSQQVTGGYSILFRRKLYYRSILLVYLSPILFYFYFRVEN
jgi:hypothetical protein